MRYLAIFGMGILLCSCAGTMETLHVCGPAWPACVMGSLRPTVKVDAQCENEPKTIIPAQLRQKTIAVLNWRAAPWLNQSRFNRFEGSPGMSFEYLSAMLTDSKFEAIEFKSPNRNSIDWAGFLELVGVTGEPISWVRVSIKQRGHPLCVKFEEYVARHHQWLPRRLQENGIVANQCIAVETISNPESTIGFDVVETKDSSPSDVRYSWFIRNLKEGINYAEILRHIGPGSDCPLVNVRREFVNVIRPST